MADVVLNFWYLLSAFGVNYGTFSGWKGNIISKWKKKNMTYSSTYTVFLEECEGSIFYGLNWSKLQQKMQRYITQQKHAHGQH